MSDIFTEIDEDLKRERALKLWKQYGNYAIVGVLVIIAGTAGYVAWQDYSRKQAETAAGRYVAALDEAKSGNAAQAGQALADIARGGRAGYAALARLEEAGMKANAGDIAGAVALYRQVATDDSVDQSLREAATVLAALDSLDTPQSGDVDKDLAALAAPTSPWRYLVWEIEGAAAVKAGKIDDARHDYSRISDDPEAPATLRARAAEMLAALAG